MLNHTLKFHRLILYVSLIMTGCSASTRVPPSATIQPQSSNPVELGQPEFSSEPIDLGEALDSGIFSPLPTHLSDSMQAEKTGQESFDWEPDEAEREWTAIVLHHTAASHGSVESIHEAHLKRKDKSGNPWMGIGYHFVIGNGNGMGDGEIQPTFRWREQIHGAHAGIREYNQSGIGITLIGNFEKEPPTDAQLGAVKNLVAQLKRKYHIPDDRIVGHGKLKATACPGKLFPLEEVIRAN